ncbi:hypothetical protein PG987_001478 [Apiospora arundinis]
MTETTFEKLADQHLKQLSQEALDCIYDGETDRVLVYVDGAFDKETYRGHGKLYDVLLLHFL